MPDSTSLPDQVKEDIAKLHAEINQAVNHRFLLTAAAITSFVLVARGVFPKDEPSAIAEMSVNVVTYTAFLLLVLILFLQSIRIRGVIRTYSTYLRINGYSNWEKDWYRFRRDGLSGKSIPRGYLRGSDIAKADLVAHGNIFCGISAISLLMGFYLLLIIYKVAELSFTSPHISPTVNWIEKGSLVLLVASILLNILLIVYFYWRNTRPLYPEEKIEWTWRYVLDKKPEKLNKKV